MPSTMSMSAADWTRSQRRRAGLRYQEEARKEVAPIAAATRPYGTALLIPRDVGGSKFRRTASDYTNNIAGLVAKRYASMDEIIPTVTTSGNWNIDYRLFSAIWNQSVNGPIELRIFTNTTNSIVGSTPVLNAIVVNGANGINTYVTNYTSVFRNYYFFTIKPITCNLSQTASSIIYRLEWYVNSWTPVNVEGTNVNVIGGVAVDNLGNTYGADLSNNRIIKTTPSKSSTVLVSTLTPLGLAVNSNILYIATNENAGNIIKRYDLINSTMLSPISLQPGNNNNRAVIFDSLNNMYTQSTSGLISKRDATTGLFTDIISLAGAATGTSMGYYKDIFNDEYIYYAGTNDSKVGKIRVLTNGSVPPSFTTTIVAGNGSGTDGGPAISASVINPRGVAVDTDGNIIIADTGNVSLRYVVASTGIIYTVCGIGGAGPPTNGVIGTESKVDNPWGVVFQNPSTLYFADNSNRVLRTLNLTGHY